MTDSEIIHEAVRLVNEGYGVTMRVKGRSMLPFIVGGRDSVLLERPVPPEKGQVVLAGLPDGRYVIHRIESVGDGCVTLMGDGNLSARERCGLDGVLALATHTVRDDGSRRWLYSRRMVLAARLWRWMLPVRRYLLYVYVKVNRI